MKTKQITLRFNVPTWVPGPAQWHTVKVAYKTLKFRLNPFTCMDCGVKIDHRFPEYHYNPVGKNRVLLSMSGYKLTDDKRKGVCGHCLSKRIHTLFASAKPSRKRNGVSANGLNAPQRTYKEKCDCCGETKACIDVSWQPECDIRFGSSWWNGHKMCEDCLCEAAEKGTPSSAMFSYQNGHHFPVNSVGAAIGLKHWWTVLFKAKKEKKVEIQTATPAGSESESW